MNICHILHRIYQREGQEFVAELYRELLNREPNHGELLLHVNMLSTGHSKISIVSQILSSQEAHDILISPSPPPSYGRRKNHTHPLPGVSYGRPNLLLKCTGSCWDGILMRADCGFTETWLHRRFRRSTL